MLLVDDNVDLLDVMCRVFSHRHKVLLAHDGIEAVAVIENNAVDVIISDVMMPNMDGLELCRHLKADINEPHSGDFIDGKKRSGRQNRVL